MAADVPSSVKADLHSSIRCEICKARKKKCDKGLPRCGYCTARKLACRYLHDRPRQQHGSLFVSGDPGGPFALSPVAGVSWVHPAVYSPPPLADDASQTMIAEPRPPGDVRRTVGGTICYQANSILSATGQYLDDISVRYFRGIHNSIPIMSRPRFHSLLFSFATDPQADFAVLLLSVCLLTYHPDMCERRTRSIDSTALYLATKSLFVHAQTASTITLNLVQAGILLSVYEYAHGKPEQAFITIGSCARMAYATGLKHPSYLALEATNNGHLQSDREEVNTWWGILISERIYICELAVLRQPLLSEMPEQILPSSIVPEAFNSGKNSGNVCNEHMAPDSSFVSGFGRAGQAALLMDHVLKAISASELNSNSATLGELDVALQSFLAIVMKQCQETWGIYCGAIAIAIRALFLLHWHILGKLARPFNDGFDHHDAESSGSRSALDTITKMVVDIADSHQDIPREIIDTLPPSCAYITRAALKHVRDSQRVTADAWLWKAEVHLQKSLSHFQYRWNDVRE